MRFIVDTHIWVWMTSHSHRLGGRAAELLASAESELVLSVASAWEATVKSSLGKLPLARPIDRLMHEAVALDGMALLQIEPSHLLSLHSLPFHHRDPFDRLIIAQALAEGLPIMTDDRLFARYGVRLVDASDRVP